jgi:hypothetical protein
MFGPDSVVPSWFRSLRLVSRLFNDIAKPMVYRFCNLTNGPKIKASAGGCLLHPPSHESISSSAGLRNMRKYAVNLQLHEPLKILSLAWIESFLSGKCRVKTLG